MVDVRERPAEMEPRTADAGKETLDVLERPEVREPSIAEPSKYSRSLLWLAGAVLLVGLIAIVWWSIVDQSEILGSGSSAGEGYAVHMIAGPGSSAGEGYSAHMIVGSGSSAGEGYSAHIIVGSGSSAGEDAEGHVLPGLVPDLS